MNLLIDGNYILHKNIYPLQKANQLYGMLHRSLETTLSTYRNWYPFDNIFFISDSNESSWRKEMYHDYKGNRKKDDTIDWEFVYIAYNEFKQSLPKHVKVIEGNNIEGDDWVWYIANKYNIIGDSNIIVSNDYDIKQLVKSNIDPFWINIMVNEIWGKEKIFLPLNYKLYLNNIKSNFSNDIFDLNDNNSLYSFLDSFILKREISIVDPKEALFLKVISGDASDNILSPYKAKGKTGKVRGIGAAGAKKLYDSYLKEFGDLNTFDTDFADNSADLILEAKKLQINHLDEISKNIKTNLNLIELDRIPSDIIEKMKNKFDAYM